MNTLTIGSKGEDVKYLQTKLNEIIKAGLSVDGQFGINTEKQVKIFQKINGLTADGIVGAKTWKLLENNDDEINIIHDPLNVHVTKKANRKIEYIVIHYTGSGNSKSGRAKSTKTTFQKREASSCFCVDDTDIVQFSPDIKNYYTWHCGDALKKSISGGKFKGKCMNNNSIGIEVCSNIKSGYDITKSHHMGWYYTQETLANLEKLVKYLMKKYNIDTNHILRHYDVTGKLCPACAGWIPENGGENEWLKFKSML